MGGGAVALAVQRDVEADDLLADLVRPAGTLTGAGPYSPEATFESYLEAEEIGYPAGCLLTVAWMVESYPALFGSIQPDDYLSEATRELKPFELMAAQELTADKLNTLINERLGRCTPEAFFSPAVFDEHSPEMEALCRALKWNDLTTGWTPRHRIVYARSSDDEVIPYANVKRLLQAFGDTGLPVHYDNAALPEQGSHAAYGLQWMRQVYSRIPDILRQYFPEWWK